MRLLALVRTHNRAHLLPIVLDELLRYNRLGDTDCCISLAVDRPTSDVCKIIAKYSSRIFSVIEMPFPLVSSFGERFSEGLNLQLDDAERWDLNPDRLYLADDDRWFEPNRITEELPRALATPDVDLWYCRSLFMWDEPHLYNPSRYHHTPLISRYRPGDRFPLNRMISAPVSVHDDALIQRRTDCLGTPLLDYGSFTQPERDELYKTFAAAGKIDDYTAALLRPPSNGLLNFRDTHGDFKDLYSECVNAKA